MKNSKTDFYTKFCLVGKCVLKRRTSFLGAGSLDDDSMALRAPALLLKTSNNNKSATLKSNCTMEDYNTPPESPGIHGSVESVSGAQSPVPDLSPTPSPPIPPPRTKRNKKGGSNLKSLHISPEPHQVKNIEKLMGRLIM